MDGENRPQTHRGNATDPQTEKTPQTHGRRKHHRRTEGRKATDTRREEKCHRRRDERNATDARTEETPQTHGRRKRATEAHTEKTGHRCMDGGNRAETPTHQCGTSDRNVPAMHCPLPLETSHPQSTQDGCGAPAMHPRGEAGEQEMSRFTSIKCSCNPCNNWRSLLNRRALHLE